MAGKYQDTKRNIMITPAKQLGIYIDDTGPQVVEYRPGIIRKVALPPFPAGSNKSGETFKRTESYMYDIEREQQTNYMQQLKSVISHCDNLLLFGPTNLKVELFNLLRTDNCFAKTIINVRQTSRLTESLQQDFVMDHFERVQYNYLYKINCYGEQYC